jgi:hypothetical protein
MSQDAAVATVLVAAILLVTIRSIWRARHRWTSLPPCDPGPEYEPGRDPRTDGLA